MKESKEVIYIPVLITDEIVKGLENRLYLCIAENGAEIFVRPKNFKSFYLSKVVLPKEISSADIEKEASMWFGWIERRINPQTSLGDKDYIKFGMKEFLKKFLSIKETK